MQRTARRILGRALLAVGIVLAVAVALVGVAVAVPGAAAATPGTALLRAVGAFMVVEDSLSASDYLLVLNGKVTTRAGHAAELYRRGLAPVVLVAETTEPVRGGRRAAPYYLHHQFATTIRGMGVPDSAIVFLPFPGGVTNTRDEARALRRFLGRRSGQSVIVVTSDYHTTRARFILRQELRRVDVEIRMAPAIDTNGVNARSWWRSAIGRETYRTEYLKLACAIVYCT